MGSSTICDSPPGEADEDCRRDEHPVIYRPYTNTSSANRACPDRRGMVDGSKYLHQKMGWNPVSPGC